VRRREFITLLGGAATVWPIPAKSQTDRASDRGIIGTSENDRQGQTWVEVVRLDGPSKICKWRFAIHLET
jgi:hypothetical protein